MRLPDFLVIGALKAGTTYLDELLRYHPELCLPATVKEVEFFTQHYDRGPAWYARLFAKCGSRRAGEVSPQYLSDARCPGRIHELLPEARLLVSLRDPVQRAYSQYKHWVQVSGYGGDFEHYLTDHPGAIDTGRYFGLLSRYLAFFPAEQLHAVVFEDLLDQPVQVMKGVFRFLGVDTHYAPPPLGPANVSTRPRFHRSYVRAKRVSRWLYDRRAGGRIVGWAKRTGAVRLFGERESDAFCPLTPAAAARLRDEYRDDVAMLSRLLDRDLLTAWESVTLR
jgi:Sulfotransferase domain